MSIQELQNHLPMLNIEEAVENYFGDFESYQSYLSSFLKLYGTCLENMEAAFDKSDWEALRIPVHKIKSSTGLLGGEKLMNTAALLEKATVETEISSIKNLYSDLLSQLKPFIKGLSQIELVISGV